MVASTAFSVAPEEAEIDKGEELRLFRRLATELRTWLRHALPPPHELVLSRSGIAPFLQSRLVLRNYQSCATPTTSHVRYAVAVFGKALGLEWFASRERNGASIVRAVGDAGPAPAPELLLQAESPVDGARELQRDLAAQQLVDDLHAWLRRSGCTEVSCADLVPFYGAFPRYRKGGGQGSGIKHAIVRFGGAKLSWVEAAAAAHRPRPSPPGPGPPPPPAYAPFAAPPRAAPPPPPPPPSPPGLGADDDAAARPLACSTVIGDAVEAFATPVKGSPPPSETSTAASGSTSSSTARRRRYEDLGSHVAFAQLEALRARKNDGGAFASTVTFAGDFPVLPTYLPIEEGAAACLGILGLAAADLHELRGGSSQEVTVRQSDAGLSTAGYMFLDVEPDGNYGGCKGFEGTIDQEGKVNPVRKAYEAGDGSHVFLHGGFPKLKRGILDFLDAAPTVESIGAAVKKWKGADLEAAMQAKQLAVTLCRTPAEWRASPQGRVVAALEPVTFSRAEGDHAGHVRRLKPGVRPLSDVIVVDFSHVIASPMVGRTLADFGATVFKVVTKKRPRRALFDEETNNGKQPLELDLADAADLARLWSLLDAADVLVDGYTEGALAKFGLDEAAVFSGARTSSSCGVSCYGHDGPLSAAKGFQQNANFATGVGTIADEDLLGYQLTSQTDYATGFLGAFGVVRALTERQLAAERGELAPMRVRASLCQAATWMAQFGARLPTFRDYAKRITRLLFKLDGRMRVDGNLKYLPLALTMRRRPRA
ncbi:alpha-methylacyl-CoA racemase [Aureococcus anophagefferens]|nr:alpha-methylacyl-CoA racemase [Aureococcus anophagefferens]